VAAVNRPLRHTLHLTAWAVVAFVVMELTIKVAVGIERCRVERQAGCPSEILGEWK